MCTLGASPHSPPMGTLRPSTPTSILQPALTLSHLGLPKPEPQHSSHEFQLLPAARQPFQSLSRAHRAYSMRLTAYRHLTHAAVSHPQVAAGNEVIKRAAMY